MSCFVTYGPLQYQDYTFPFPANLIGIIFALSAVSAIPTVAAYKLYTAKGKTFKEVTVLLSHLLTAKTTNFSFATNAQQFASRKKKRGEEGC